MPRRASADLSPADYSQRRRNSGGALGPRRPSTSASPADGPAKSPHKPAKPARPARRPSTTTAGRSRRRSSIATLPSRSQPKESAGGGGGGAADKQLSAKAEAALAAAAQEGGRRKTRRASVTAGAFADVHPVDCRNGCGRRLMACDAASHERETCPRRFVACEHCGLRIQARKLRKHVQGCVKLSMAEEPSSGQEEEEQEEAAAPVPVPPPDSPPPGYADAADADTNNDAGESKGDEQDDAPPQPSPPRTDDSEALDGFDDGAMASPAEAKGTGAGTDEPKSSAKKKRGGRRGSHRRSSTDPVNVQRAVDAMANEQQPAGAKKGHRRRRSSAFQRVAMTALSDAQSSQGGSMRGTTECEFCGETVRSIQLPIHVEFVCEDRPRPCKHGCAASVRPSLQKKHDKKCPRALEAAEAVKRAKARREPHPCPGCGAMIVPRDLPAHQAEECPERLVACRYHLLGCTEELTASAAAAHERQCKANIRAKVAAKQVRERAKPKPCPGCGVELKATRLAAHQADECEAREIPCKNQAQGCPAVLPARDMPAHHKVCRVVRRRMSLAAEHQLGMQEFACDQCGTSVQARRLEAHRQRECPKRLIRCVECAHSMPMDHERHHRDHDCTGPRAVERRRMAAKGRARLHWRKVREMVMAGGKFKMLARAMRSAHRDDLRRQMSQESSAGGEAGASAGASGGASAGASGGGSAGGEAGAAAAAE